MVDQDLVIDAGAITSTLTPEEQSRIQALLLTHQHLDHIRDVPIRLLAEKLEASIIPAFEGLVVEV